MKLVKPLMAVALSAGLVGCTGAQEYQAYVQAHRVQAQEAAKAETAKYKALGKIAESGDSAAMVAAVLSMNAGSSRGQARSIPVPESGMDKALKWAGTLLPTVVQGYGIFESNETARHRSDNTTRYQINSSDNNAAVRMNTNTTMQGISELITVPEPTVVNQPAPVVVEQPAPTVVNPEVVNPEVVRPEVIQQGQ